MPSKMSSLVVMRRKAIQSYKYSHVKAVPDLLRGRVGNAASSKIRLFENNDGVVIEPHIASPITRGINIFFS
jgi:hypothetical protein